MLPAWRYLQDASSHPLVRRVASWGDPTGIALDAKREADSPRYKGGGWLVTDKYLIQRTAFTFDVLRLSDLLWAYKRVTRDSVNFIPTGKTYVGVLACYGGTAEVRGRETKVDAVLTFAAERAPWAAFGFSEELSKLFRHKTQEFCSAVEQKRRESRVRRACPTCRRLSSVPVRTRRWPRCVNGRYPPCHRHARLPMTQPEDITSTNNNPADGLRPPRMPIVRRRKRGVE